MPNITLNGTMQHDAGGYLNHRAQDLWIEIRAQPGASLSHAISASHAHAAAPYTKTKTIPVVLHS